MVEHCHICIDFLVKGGVELQNHTYDARDFMHYG